HHDIHQHNLHVRLRLKDPDGIPSVIGGDHDHVMLFKDGGQSENIPHVVVHDQDLAVGQHLVGLMQIDQDLPLVVGQSSYVGMREEDRIVQQAIGGLDAAEGASVPQATPLATVTFFLFAIHNQRHAAQSL